MTLDLLQGFRVGCWTVEPHLGVITGPDGVARHLEPKVMDVLVYLASSAGEPVLRDAVLADVWGDRAVSDEPLTRVIGELRRALNDDARRPTYIETIPKRGYRLVSDVCRLDGSPFESEPAEASTALPGAFSSDFFRTAAIVIIGLLVVGTLSIAYLWPLEPTLPGDPTKDRVTDVSANSVAILPFADMSEGADYEYFGDGIAEEILNSLANVRGIHVVARTSSFSFRESESTVPQIAETLGVATVLQGSVRISGEQVRVTAQLIDAKSGLHLWSDTWERPITDVFAIQDEIAAGVVEFLQVALLEELPAVRRTDPEAYELYLRSGQQAWRLTPESMDEASRLLIQALAIDPEYASAWGRLAINQYHQALRGWADPDREEGFARAEASARRALKLDPNNVSALQTLGMVSMFARWDLAEARDWFDRAHDAGPGRASPFNALGIWNNVLGRREAARSLFRQAFDLDPLQLVYLGHLASTNYTTGRFDIAREQIKAMTKLDPESAYVPFHSGWLEWHQRNYERALLHAGQREGSYALAACSYHRLGRFLDAQAALEKLQTLNPHGVAVVYSCWGDADKAFEWLERALEQGTSELITLRGNFIFEPLHDDPRWQPLLRKLGIADEQVAMLGH